MIDAPLLAAVYRRPIAKVAPAVGPMREALEFAQINTDRRLVHWLAQVGHESGHLVYTREIWGPTKQQLRYERRFDQPWPRTVAEAKRPAFAANRLAHALGNASAGAGKRYMGRGWIQTTGLANYLMTRAKMREAMGSSVPDFVADPAQLERLQWAALSAALYWRERDLNRLADAEDIVKLTRQINGGLNGLADRQALRVRALCTLAICRIE